MKRYILNGISLTQKELYGVHRYAAELLREMDRFVPAGKVEVVIPENGARELSFNNITVTKVPVDANEKMQLRRWNWFGFSRYVRDRGGISFDLTLTLPVGSCDVIAIHDCIVERCKENANTLFKKFSRLLYILKAGLNIRRAKAIVTVSRYSKRDIAALYRIPEKKIAVIYSSWQHFERIVPDESVLERYGLAPDGYFFALGSRFYHKNFKWVVEAARQNSQYKFIVSGTDSISSSDTSLNCRLDNLIYAGYLSDEEVKALMAHCRAFIQASIYEGFGLPPLEAMSAGAPCIVSNAASLPEIYGNSVRYIDPFAYDGINMDRIMEEPCGSNETALARYSWEHSAHRLYRLLCLVEEKSKR